MSDQLFYDAHLEGHPDREPEDVKIPASWGMAPDIWVFGPSFHKVVTNKTPTDNMGGYRHYSYQYSIATITEKKWSDLMIYQYVATEPTDSPPKPPGEPEWDSPDNEPEHGLELTFVGTPFKRVKVLGMPQQWLWMKDGDIKDGEDGGVLREEPDEEGWQLYAIELLPSIEGVRNYSGELKYYPFVPKLICLNAGPFDKSVLRPNAKMKELSPLEPIWIMGHRYAFDGMNSWSCAEYVHLESKENP